MKFPPALAQQSSTMFLFTTVEAGEFDKVPGIMNLVARQVSSGDHHGQERGDVLSKNQTAPGSLGVTSGEQFMVT